MFRALEPLWYLEKKLEWYPHPYDAEHYTLDYVFSYFILLCIRIEITKKKWVYRWSDIDARTGKSCTSPLVLALLIYVTSGSGSTDFPIKWFVRSWRNVLKIQVVRILSKASILRPEQREKTKFIFFSWISHLLVWCSARTNQSLFS